MSLSCYTLTDFDLKPGIEVSAFESIVTLSVGTTVVDKAKMHTIPILSTPIGKRTRDASTCLIFLEEVDSSVKASLTGVLIAVDPASWCLYSKEVKAVLVDPCSPSGKIILFLPSLGDIFLVSTITDGLTLSVSTSGRPKLCQHNKANLLIGTLLGLPARRLSFAELEGLPKLRKSPASATKHKDSQPRNRQVALS